MADSFVLLNDGTSFVLLNDGSSKVILNAVTGEGVIIEGTHAQPLISRRQLLLLPVEFTFLIRAGIIVRPRFTVKVEAATLVKSLAKVRFQSTTLTESLSPFKFKSALIKPASSEKFQIFSTMFNFKKITNLLVEGLTKSMRYERRKSLTESEKDKKKAFLQKLLDSFEDDE